MTPMIKPAMGSFRYSNFIMNLVLGDIKNMDAIRRSRNGEGASISWITGHLLDYRHQVMNLFGANKEREYRIMFNAKGASDGSDYPDISELLTKWNLVHVELEGEMEKVTDKQLNARIENGLSLHHEKTILDTLIFYMWHESYHIGALGMIRRMMGYPAIADLALDAVKPKGV